MMGVLIDLHDGGFWKTETWKDYPAPIVRRCANGSREGVLATYGMVPRKRIPAGVRPFDTMNARVETVGQLRSFSGAWKRSQLCLIPMIDFLNRATRAARRSDGASAWRTDPPSPWRACGVHGKAKPGQKPRSPN
jgi:putative SOS response-associated peptidase YedK